jgi:prepilin-type N-terminal cleavage/methylation domain-containing protein/prepilin-type processing-associated H-X9-DG protein
MIRRTRSAFTLIELLVVIAIIAILAAILFPVFAQARESARMTSCLSNMKQLSLGMLMYVQDYDEKFPGSRIFCADATGQPIANCIESNRDTGNIWGWRSATKPYTKNIGIFQCPSNSARDLKTEEWDKTFPQSYASNGVLIFNTRQGPLYPNNSGGAPANLAGIGRPAETMMLLESTWAENDLGDWVGRKTNPTACDWGGYNGFFRHRGTRGITNWAFFDGHVKGMRSTEIWKIRGGAPERYNMWGREEAINAQELAWDDVNNICAEL